MKSIHQGDVRLHKTFRLISMYIGDFDCLKRQLLQFCSDYKTSIVHVSSNELHLNVKHKQVLPTNFFELGEDSEGNGCVNSVSAIIGKNGSGKTTLARLFCNLSASDDRKPNWKVVLIYEVNGSLHAYSTFQQVKINDGSVKCDFDSLVNWPYSFFYYSPHFTTEQFDVYTIGYHADRQTREEGDFVSDISTTGLMLHPEGNSELLLRGGRLQSSIFDTDEKIRLFEFISRYYTKNEEFLMGDDAPSSGRRGRHARNPLNKFTIPKPTAISIGIHTEGFMAAVRDMSDKVEACKRKEGGVQTQIYSTLRSSPEELRDPVGDYLSVLMDSFEQFIKGRNRYGLVCNVFMSYAARYIQECGMFNPSFPTEILQRGFLLALKNFMVGGGWTNDENIKEFLRANPPSLSQGGVGLDAASQGNPMLELVELLQKFCECSKSQVPKERPVVSFDNREKVLLCRLDDDSVLKDVCRLVRLHGDSRKISSFMKFDVLPHMSSGEMSFLMLFARLYHFVDKVPSGSNVVVFLDEAETTLHPEWQRCLVAYCIRFFEIFLPNRQYQLIFASHSPILLSDIPKGNVCCLDRNKKGECYVRNIAVDNTFAANVYELFDTSYFLKGGPIGDFAQAKIRGLTRSDEGKIIGLIGDELLKRLLQRRSLCVK